MYDFRKFLRYVDTTELQEKICEFRKLDFKNLTNSEIHQAIFKVIMFKTPEGDVAELPTSTASYPKETRFYRIRTLSETDRRVPLNSMSLVSDCWAPPSNIVQTGRLNKAGEPLLYTTPCNYSIAVEEMKIREDQLFSLIVYESVDTIKVAHIGIRHTDDNFSKEETLKQNMLQDFLSHEFTRDVGKGTEFLYKISEAIIKDYFDLPPSVQNAWCYPSVAKKNGVNVCFRPDDSKLKLKLIGVLISYAKKVGEDYLLSPKVFAQDSSDGINLNYYVADSVLMNRLFSESLYPKDRQSNVVSATV